MHGAQAAKFQALNLKIGAMNAMKFIKIYAASVHDTMRQARRRLARREVLTADLSRKILSAHVSKRSFKRGISSAQILKGEILKVNLDR
nr:hypothetical protein [uncultured Campylobacter sp.]